MVKALHASARGTRCSLWGGQTSGCAGRACAHGMHHRGQGWPWPWPRERPYETEWNARGKRQPLQRFARPTVFMARSMPIGTRANKDGHRAGRAGRRRVAHRHASLDSIPRGWAPPRAQSRRAATTTAPWAASPRARRSLPCCQEGDAASWSPEFLRGGPGSVLSVSQLRRRV